VKKSAHHTSVKKKLEHEITVLKSDVSALKHTATRKHGLSKANAEKLKRDDSSLRKDETRLAKDERGHKHKHEHKTKRKLSPGWDVACCTALGLAASARLAGYPVSYDDVLGLYWRTASDPDEGASVWDTLLAAREFGLGGVRPWFRPLEYPADLLGHGHGKLSLGAYERDEGTDAVGFLLGGDLPPACGQQLVLAGDQVAGLAPVDLGQQPPRYLRAGGKPLIELRPVHPAIVDGMVPLCAPDVQWPGLPALCLRSLTAYPGGGAGSLIIGLQLPGGPHTLTLGPSGGVWSWDELHDPAAFAGAAIEEAWAVGWTETG
jgi:hypothetical protein